MQPDKMTRGKPSALLFLRGKILLHRHEKYLFRPIAGHMEGAQAGQKFSRHTKPITVRPIFQTLGKGK
jgi:hypothetical protein